MSLHSWLRSLRAQIALSKTVRRGKLDAPRTMQLAESLEPRCLLAVTPILINGTDLQVQLESSDNVSIQANSAGNSDTVSATSAVVLEPRTTSILKANSGLRIHPKRARTQSGRKRGTPPCHIAMPSSRADGSACSYGFGVILVIDELVRVGSRQSGGQPTKTWREL